jgi:hypothetical protein
MRFLKIFESNTDKNKVVDEVVAVGDFITSTRQVF